MASGERKSTEPRRHSPPRRLAGAGGEGGPAGVLASQVLGVALPRADRTEKVPRRRKAPDFSNSDVQRATLAIHSLGLVCVFFLFLYFFFFSVFVLSAPLEMPPPPPWLSLGPPAKEPPSPSPSAAPRQRQSPARTCPEVSGAGKDAGSLRPGGADPAGGEEPSEDAPSQDILLTSGSPVAVRKDSSSCKIGIFRSLGKKK